MVKKFFRKIKDWIVRFAKFFKRSSKKVKLLIIVVAAGLIWIISSQLNNDPGYTFDTVKKVDIVEVVSESGSIIATGNVSHYSPTNGIVDEIFVKNGDYVEAGQKLFNVASTATAGEKKAAYATYQAAVAAASQAENNRRNTRAVLDSTYDTIQGSETDETFAERSTRTTAEVNHDNAYEALLSAKASLASAYQEYLATQSGTVTAANSGKVSNLSVSEGGSVLVNSALSPTSPVLIVKGNGPTEILIEVKENDINKIKVGQEVDITVDAIGNKTYKGIVVRADDEGTITQGVVNFNVYIDVIDIDDQLKTGMSIDVDIVTSELEDILSVPNSAVKRHEGKRAVRILGEDGEIEYLPVEIGIRGEDRTQILSGVEEGTRIISSLTSSAEKSSPLGF